MKKTFNIITILSLLLLVVAPMTLTSCDNNDFDTQQFVGGVHLNSFGPCPVARGGELRFIGSGMNQITKVSIPGCSDITDINVISETEIRVMVPMEAEEGLVGLTFAGGNITTKTPITFTEPIEIEAIEPSTVKPGDELTITGSYLNLMKEVCFSFVEGGDSVNVYATDFIAHERGKIVVVVPEEAVTGPIFLSDAAEMPNMIRSEQTVAIVLPSVEAPLDLTNAVPGSTVTVAGKDFDLVRKVAMPDGSEVSFDYDKDAGSISFKLPTNVSDGAVVAIPASGVKVAIANIGVVVPTDVTVTPAEGVRAGYELTFKGVNMDQVASLSFVNVADPIAPVSISATEIVAKFPAMAQSGPVTLNLHSGKSVSVEISTAKPEVMGFNPAEVPAGSDVVLQGKNLDLIVGITFGGGATVEVSNNDPSAVSVSVPVNADSGALTLVMANGETATTATLTVLKPECAYIPGELPTDLTAGDLFLAELANADVLVDVQVNGESVKYVVNNSNLYFTLPASCGMNTTLVLVSSNGTISYTFDVTPTSHVEIIAYGGEPRDLGSWAGEDAGGAFRIYKDVFEGVPAGAMLVFHVAPYGDYSDLQINDANWGQIDLIKFYVGETKVPFELTESVLKRIMSTNDGWSNTGLVIQGCNAIVSKVTIEFENAGGGSSETVIFQGPWTCSGWNGNQDLAWGGYDWASVKAGSTLHFFMTPTVAADAWWCISLRHGDSWGNIPGLPTQYDTPVDGLLDVVLTQDVLDDIIKGNGLVITGDGYILDKITLE